MIHQRKNSRRGKQGDQFIVGNSPWLTPGEVSSAPAPRFWDRGRAACVPESTSHPTPRGWFPSKTKSEELSLE